MKKNKQKTKAIFAWFILLNFLFAGAYVYAFYTVKVKNEDASLVSGELEEYLSKEGTINLLKRAVKDTEEERQKMTSYFVSRDDLPEFAKRIESLGEMPGVLFTIEGFREQDDILSFDLSSEGNFQDTLHLVSLIESLPFKIDIKKAYISMTEINIPEEAGGGVKIVWEGNFSVELLGFIGK